MIYLILAAVTVMVSSGIVAWAFLELFGGSAESQEETKNDWQTYDETHED